MSNHLCTLVVCGAPLARRAGDIVAELARVGWRVKVVLTPSALAWVTPEDLPPTVLSSRSGQRDPATPKNRERPAVVIVAPITFNTVGKMANGIADTLAHSTLSEALGAGIPVVALPMVNNLLWGHPAWHDNIQRLDAAGVRWIDMHNGAAGQPQAVESGTGEDLVQKFDPTWITEVVSSLM